MSLWGVVSSPLSSRLYRTASGALLSLKCRELETIICRLSAATFADASNRCLREVIVSRLHIPDDRDRCAAPILPQQLIHWHPEACLTQHDRLEIVVVGVVSELYAHAPHLTVLCRRYSFHIWAVQVGRISVPSPRFRSCTYGEPYLTKILIEPQDTDLA